MAFIALLEILALATATLLACRKFGTRNLTPVAVLPLAAALIGVIDFDMASPMVMAPPVGLIVAIQLERGRPYGELIGAASLPGLALGLFMMTNIEQWGANPEQLTVAMSQLEESGTPEEIAAIQALRSTIVRLLPGFAIVSVLLTAVFVVPARLLLCGAPARLRGHSGATARAHMAPVGSSHLGSHRRHRPVVSRQRLARRPRAQRRDRHAHSVRGPGLLRRSTHGVAPGYYRIFWNCCFTVLCWPLGSPCRFWPGLAFSTRGSTGAVSLIVPKQEVIRSESDSLERCGPSWSGG